MNLQIFIGLMLSILPIFELRGGLPIVMEYCMRNNISILPYFFVVLFLNIIVVIFIFIFLDFIHNKLMKWKWYNIKAKYILGKLQGKIESVEYKMNKFGYLALILFVSIPFPGTGVWTGTFIAWSLGLNRIKSFIAIAAGVIISGILILLLSLGVFGIVYS